MLDEIIIYTDGGSRGNPGPAAGGYILTDKAKNQLCARGVFLGETTNNVAEYTGFIKALEAAKSIGARCVTVFSDSELLVRQINGQYRVKSENLVELYNSALELLSTFGSWKVIHVPRDKNSAADKLVNLALDKGRDVAGAFVKSPSPEIKAAPLHKAAKSKPIRLGVLISGGGTTLLNILEYIKSGQLNTEVAVVISSLSTAGGVEKAKKAGLNVKIIRKKDYPDMEQFSGRIEEELDAAKVDLVVQGGWLCLWKIPAKYENRVMNIHPALLPSFGGKGMWGHHVHEAVLKAGCKISGCTVHFCTNEYDAGPIIVQRCCEVKEGDTPETLAARVFEQECIAYPEAIRLFAEDKVVIKNGRAEVKP